MPGAIENKFIVELRGHVRGHRGVTLIDKKGDLEGFAEFGNDGKKLFSYEPDIVIKVNGKITHIIEVETDPVRKALVGGACTAAYFIDKHFKDLKPRLYFAVGRKDIKYQQLEKQQARLHVINRWCKDIFRDIKIEKYEKVMERLKAELGINERKRLEKVGGK